MEEQPRFTWLRKLLKDMSGAYAEIGVCHGGLSEFLLKETPVGRLFCIDPYRKFDDALYVDTLNSMSQQDMDIKYLQVWHRLKGNYISRVELIRECSVYAAMLFPKDSMDFVYIDANHSFNAVRMDIMTWILKIKPGGILAGDDVESLDLPHVDGNARIVHSTGAYSDCGVHAALEAVRADNPWFDYQVVGSQWFWRRPLISRKE